MAVTATCYGKHFEGQWGSTAARRIDWPADTVKCMLTTNAYTPDPDTHDFINDVTNEVTGAGYTAGGATVGSKTVTYDSATNETRMDCADPAWTGFDGDGAQGRVLQGHRHPVDVTNDLLG